MIRDRLRLVMSLALVGWLAGCALSGGTAGAEPAATIADRPGAVTRAAALQRDGLRAMNAAARNGRRP